MVYTVVWRQLASILKCWPKLRPKGQTFGLGFLTLASASTLWPKPKVLAASGFETNILASASTYDLCFEIKSGLGSASSFRRRSRGRGQTFDLETEPTPKFYLRQTPVSRGRVLSQGRCYGAHAKILACNTLRPRPKVCYRGQMKPKRYP